MKVVKLLKNEAEAKRLLYNVTTSRFLSVDPLTATYPHYTPYSYAGNTPIQAIDLDGLEEYHYKLTLDKQGQTHLTLSSLVKYYMQHSWLGGLIQFKTKINVERALVEHEGKKYYIGFAGSVDNASMSAFVKAVEVDKIEEKDIDNFSITDILFYVDLDSKLFVSEFADVEIEQYLPDHQWTGLFDSPQKHLPLPCRKIWVIKTMFKFRIRSKRDTLLTKLDETSYPSGN